MLNYGDKNRCEVFGEYIIENEATVRSTANHFGISKSTVHKDVTVNLKYVNRIIYEKVKDILLIHKETRHIRGGEATRKKYLERAYAKENDIK